jgi:hypothetical protein
MSGADRAWAGQYERGDVVRYSNGSKTYGLEPGEYARVAGVDREKNLVTVQRSSGEQVTYDPRRLQGVSVYKESERAISQGDRLQFTAPSKELGVTNRSLGTVEKIEPNGEMRLRMDSGRSVDFNVKQHPHVDYGYAVTSHSGQGKTAGRVLVHVDTDKGEQLVNRRMGYVSVSRGSHDVQVFTNDKGLLGEKLGRDVSHATAIGKGANQEVARDAALGTAATSATSLGVTAALTSAKIGVSKAADVVRGQGEGQGN